MKLGAIFLLFVVVSVQGRNWRDVLRSFKKEFAQKDADWVGKGDEEGEKFDEGLRCNGIDDGCCTESNPCTEGDGDCDNDKQCQGSLVCGTNNCPTRKLPFVNQHGNDDCCTKPPLRCNGIDDGCCTESNPCTEGDGDCDNDKQCQGSLVCGTNNCPTRKPPFVNQHGNDDCCAKPALRCNGKDDGCCTESNPCTEGDGDCDNDKQCQGSLVCGTNNCPRKLPFVNKYGNDDCCAKPPKGDEEGEEFHEEDEIEK